LWWTGSISARTSGRPSGQLARHLQARHPRHRDIEDGEVDALLEGQAQRLDAVARSRHHLQIGYGIEDELEAVADELVVVGEEDPGRKRDRHQTVGSAVAASCSTWRATAVNDCPTSS
jgi:hypothetical protein